MCKLPVWKIPLSGSVGAGKHVLVDGDYDGEYLAQFKWRLNPKTGYVTRKPFRHEGTSSIYMHHVVGGKPPAGYVVSFKNREKLDCRSCNIEWITPSDIAANRPQAKLSVTGFRGVHKTGGKKDGKTWVGKTWRAQCAGSHVGVYSTPEDAARAYDEVALGRWGTKAQLNFRP